LHGIKKFVINNLETRKTGKGLKKNNQASTKIANVAGIILQKEFNV